MINRAEASPTAHELCVRLAIQPELTALSPRGSLAQRTWRTATRKEKTQSEYTSQCARGCVPGRPPVGLVPQAHQRDS